MPTVFNGFATSAAALLAGENNGMAMDFISASDSLYIKDSTGSMGYYGVPFTNNGGKIDFSRASLATVTDADGKIKWAQHNLLLASEQFDASVWGTTSGVTITANDAVAPNGTTTADKYTATNAVNFRGQSGVTVAAAQYTYSCFAKRGNTDWVYMNTSQVGPGDLGAWFDIQNGVKGNTDAGISSDIQSAGNGWYIISITWTTIAANLISVLPRPRSGNGSTVTSVNDFVYIWGAHLYRTDLGGMQANDQPAPYSYYNSTTPKNLIGYSEAFDNVAWSKAAVTVTANAVAAPNGSMSADKVVASSGGGYHSVYQGFAYTGAKTTISVYAKAAEYNLLQFADAINGKFRASFNLTSGEVVAGSTGGTPFVSASVVSAGDGWYRCSVVLEGNSGTIGLIMVGYPSGATLGNFGPQYTGDGTSGVYLWGAQLSDSASLDPYVPKFGAAPSAAAYYGPRIDYDATSLTPKGLLIEEQRSNLLLRSQEFNTTWTPTRATVGSDVTATNAPDGSTSADKIIEDNTASDTHYIGQTYTFTGVQTHTFSVFLKAGERTWARLNMGTAAFSGDKGAYFNLSNGTVGTVDAGTTASIESSGNGWYRCRITATSITGGLTASYRIFVSAGDGVISYTGNGTSGIYVWGAQLEAGSFATSYIPTVASSVTRSGDAVSFGVSQFPYSSTSGTVIASSSSFGVAGSYRNVLIMRNTATSVADRLPDMSLAVGTGGGPGAFRIDTFNASVNIATLGTTSAFVQSANYNIGYVYAENDFAAYGNGISAGTDSSGALPSGINTLEIGNRVGVGQLCGYIRQITYIPRRISNAELVTKTSA